MIHPAWTTPPPVWPPQPVYQPEQGRIDALRELAVRVYEGLDEGRAWMVARHLTHPTVSIRTWQELCDRIGLRIGLAGGVVDPVDVVTPDLIAGLPVHRQVEVAVDVADGKTALTCYRLLRGEDTFPCPGCFHDPLKTIVTWEPLHSCTTPHGAQR